MSGGPECPNAALLAGSAASEVGNVTPPRRSRAGPIFWIRTGRNFRFLRLEADERQIVTEARSAAIAAATEVAGAVISDTVTRVTRLEGRTDQLEQKRLPSA